MKLRISLTQAVAVAAIVTATLPLLPINAAAQIAVSSNDGKLVLSNGTVSVPANPGDDTVTIIDLGVSPPKVIAEFKAPSSVVGPPQNVAVAPDESFALVAATMKLDPADPKKQVPDSRLSVIDLKANPPSVIATLEAGLGPSGIAINPAGTLALVANYREGTVSIFTISGKTLTAAGKMISAIRKPGRPQYLSPQMGRLPWSRATATTAFPFCRLTAAMSPTPSAS